MKDDGRRRVVIDNVRPEIDCGRFPVKRTVGEKVKVTADFFADSHDDLSARLLYRREQESGWNETVMRETGNDRWEGEFLVEQEGIYRYTLEGWIDPFKTWQRDLKKKIEAGDDVTAELQRGGEYLERASRLADDEGRKTLTAYAGAMRGADDLWRALATAESEEVERIMKAFPDRSLSTRYEKELSVRVDRRKALFSAWYELFPRSCRPGRSRHGTLADCESLLPGIAAMGFDVVYLPPLHPIGRTNRKGRNNSVQAGPDDVGSPWAIGSEEGGHKALHPQLGTMEDFERLVAAAERLGIEIALDLAFQCSPDHPYVKEHPEWFRWRPDGTVQWAENPPKKYEDIIPLNFETEAWQPLWDELKSIVLFWREKGVRLFRVDNPHTKPFPFWEWLIAEVKREHPDVLFLAEAFTRPKVMHRLAKIGFTQSYTYFTWRNTKRELLDYLTEIVDTETREYFRPNLWPNTPDILPEFLQYGGRPAFISRLVLAATLSPSYGIYGPPFELCVSAALPGREEYLDSEKYEIRDWSQDPAGTLHDLIARVNRIRRENPALQSLHNLRFVEVENESLLCYEKSTEDLSNTILVVVSLDPFHTQSGWLRVPTQELGLPSDQPYLVHDLLSDDKFVWQGERNYVQLHPHVLPASLFRIRKRMKREMDFDYYM